MGLAAAMNTAVSGLQTSQVMLETIGDNIANVNTTAFKSNRVDLESQFALTLRGATAPGDVLGGTNPVQVGLGSAVGQGGVLCRQQRGQQRFRLVQSGGGQQDQHPENGMMGLIPMLKQSVRIGRHR